MVFVGRVDRAESGAHGRSELRIARYVRPDADRKSSRTPAVAGPGSAAAAAGPAKQLCPELAALPRGGGKPAAGGRRAETAVLPARGPAPARRQHADGGAVMVKKLRSMRRLSRPPEFARAARGSFSAGPGHWTSGKGPRTAPGRPSSRLAPHPRAAGGAGPAAAAGALTDRRLRGYFERSADRTFPSKSSSPPPTLPVVQLVDPAKARPPTATAAEGTPGRPAPAGPSSPGPPRSDDDAARCRSSSAGSQEWDRASDCEVVSGKCAMSSQEFEEAFRGCHGRAGFETRTPGRTKDGGEKRRAQAADGSVASCELEREAFDQVPQPGGFDVVCFAPVLPAELISLSPTLKHIALSTGMRAVETAADTPPAFEIGYSTDMICDFLEGRTGDITLPGFSPFVLLQVVRYLRRAAESRRGSDDAAVPAVFWYPLSQVVDILAAGHYLQLKGLVRRCCVAIAENVSRLPAVRDLPPQLLELVLARATVASLCSAERILGSAGYSRECLARAWFRMAEVIDAHRLSERRPRGGERDRAGGPSYESPFASLAESKRRCLRAFLQKAIPQLISAWNAGREGRRGSGRDARATRARDLVRCVADSLAVVGHDVDELAIAIGSAAEGARGAGGGGERVEAAVLRNVRGMRRLSFAAARGAPATGEYQLTLWRILKALSPTEAHAASCSKPTRLALRVRRDVPLWLEQIVSWTSGAARCPKRAPEPLTTLQAATAAAAAAAAASSRLGKDNSLDLTGHARPIQDGNGAAPLAELDEIFALLGGTRTAESRAERGPNGTTLPGSLQWLSLELWEWAGAVACEQFNVLPIGVQRGFFAICRLDLSDAPLCPVSIERLRSALESPASAVEHLDVSRTGLDRPRFSSVVLAAATCARLKALLISGNLKLRPDKEPAEVDGRLSSADVAGIRGAVGRSIAALLAGRASALEELDVSGNELTTVEGVALSSALRSSVGELRVLDVRDACIGVPAVAGLKRALSASAKLTALRIGGNPLPPRAMAEVLGSLRPAPGARGSGPRVTAIEVASDQVDADVLAVLSSLVADPDRPLLELAVRTDPGRSSGRHFPSALVDAALRSGAQRHLDFSDYVLDGRSAADISESLRSAARLSGRRAALHVTITACRAGGKPAVDALCQALKEVCREAPAPTPRPGPLVCVDLACGRSLKAHASRAGKNLASVCGRQARLRIFSRASS
ncbi:MAG: hypothetical protein BJ554DRAFT_7709 [Olpidium bornovanus]|uniref:Uncharacterized protein n=1 Tax=Olpidium bornovanus TaxID=278681 RepID=A0A8H8A1R0_9FUNG|nr:MAG: hypothetical protein BJ554DRAFT_7709 [Olpidium bornovanus]